MIVANGRVCFINGTLFLASKNSTDPASSRAAVNLAMPRAGSPPSNPLGDIGTDFIYGDPGKIISSPGEKIGQLAMDANGNLLPTINTHLNIELFAVYWNQAQLTTNSYSIDTLSVKLKADEVLQAQVSTDVNQAALPADWHVVWELYPSAPMAVGYPQVYFYTRCNPDHRPASRDPAGFHDAAPGKHGIARRSHAAPFIRVHLTADRWLTSF